jgi:hypothetical protein
MKLLPFDLEKALNGAKLVTESGHKATNPRLINGLLYVDMDFAGTPESSAYSLKGICPCGGTDCDFNLFISAETPAPDLLPNYKRMYEMLYETLEDGILPDRQKTIVKELLLTAKID